MNKTKHTIVLNGRHYNAKTGERLSHSGKFAHDHVAEASHRTPVHKPISHHAAAGPRKAARRTARQPAKHVTPHAPKATRTLMRQAVAKPGHSFKRRIRVQGHLDSQIKQPDIKPARRQAVQARHRTVKAARVHLIHHFSPELFTMTEATVIATKPAPKRIISDKPIANNDVTPQPTMRPAFAPKKPQTTADLLDYVVRYAYDPHDHGPEKPAHRKRARKHRRAHAAAH